MPPVAGTRTQYSKNPPTPQPSILSNITISSSSYRKVETEPIESTFPKSRYNNITTTSNRTPIYKPNLSLDPQCPPCSTIQQPTTTSSSQILSATIPKFLESVMLSANSLPNQIPVLPTPKTGEQLSYSPNNLPDGAVLAFMPVIFFPNGNCNQNFQLPEEHKNFLPVIPSIGFTHNSLQYPSPTASGAQQRCMCPCSCEQNKPQPFA